MQKISVFSGISVKLILGVTLLVIISLVVLYSIAPFLFPSYLFYVFLAAILFYFFTKIDFDIFLLFSKHIYVFSIVLLLLTLVIGQVTRGAVRWIPLGPISIQPSEIARPFLLLFFAKFITDEELNLKRLGKTIVVFLVPFVLILIQPSLGVALLTAAGFIGALLASSISKRNLLIFAVFLALIAPLFWFILAPYQKERVTAFLDPGKDPYGTGYNSIQSMISVGSGRIFGRGLGRGIQTQLQFLPEKHTDFIFAATAEELGLIGALLLLVGLFIVLWSLTIITENAVNPTARVFVSALFIVLLSESVIHIGMNMSLLPVTGVPLPFVSAGGSALVGSSMALAIAISAKKKE